MESKRTDGFTLIEMLIVTMVFLIVLTMASELIVRGTFSYRKAISDVKKRQTLLQGVDSIASEFRSTLGRDTAGSDQGLDAATRNALQAGTSEITFRRQWGSNPNDTIAVRYYHDATERTIMRTDTITSSSGSTTRGPFVVARDVKTFNLRADTVPGGPPASQVPMIDVRVVARDPGSSASSSSSSGSDDSSGDGGSGSSGFRSAKEAVLESKVQRRVVKEADEASAVWEAWVR